LPSPPSCRRGRATFPFGFLVRGVASPTPPPHPSSPSLWAGVLLTLPYPKGEGGKATFPFGVRVGESCLPYPFGLLEG